MSFNQSRAEKSEGQQLRKSGRSGSFSQQRGYSRGGGGGGGGGKGGGSAPPTQLSSSSSFPSYSSNHPPLSTNRSVKKSGHGQGGSSRANSSSSSSGTSFVVASAPPVALPAVRNGAHVQPPLHGSSDAATSSSAKPVDAPIPRNSRAHPRAPISQSAAGTSDPEAPVIPAKGDGSKTLTLQFGSISPGIVDEMQIPARTTSAPPNLDEQKKDQAHHGSFRGVPKVPIPSGPQQPLQPKKDASGVNQSDIGESLPPAQVKQDMHSQISAAPAVLLPKSSVLPIAGISLPMAFQQPQVPLQFGGPSPQLQSQGVAASSLQMPMTLPIGHVPQVPQQMFLHGLQSHPLQPQLMMHQGQGLNFAPQTGHQLPPQLGNLGISIATQQFAQQQPGKFGASRKTTVKITHPETHEELRLDKRTDSYTDGGFTHQRSLPNVTSQSQPVPSLFPSHFYPPLQPNSYNTSQMFFPTSTSLPLTSSQMPSGSQAPRYSYPVGQIGQGITFMHQSVIKPMPGGKAGSPLHSLTEPMKVETVPVSAPSAIVHGNKPGTASVTVSMPTSSAEAPTVLKPSREDTSSHPQSDGKVGLECSVRQSKSASQPSETTQAAVSSVPDAPHEDYGPVETGTGGRIKEPVERMNLLRDNQKKPNKKDLRHSQHPQQTDASESADTDGMMRQLSRNSEELQDFSGVDMLTTPTSLYSPSLEQSSSTEIRTSKDVESKLVLTDSESSGVNLVEEVLQDVCLRADNGILVKERGYSETSTSTGLEMDETVTKNLYPTLSWANSILLDVEPEVETLAEKELRETGVSIDSSQDTGNAKMHPISVFTECVEGGKPAELADQDGAGKDNSESLAFCESYDAERQQPASYNEAVGQSLMVERTNEELDISSNKSLDFTKAEAVPSSHLSSANIEESKPSSIDAITSKAIYSQDVGWSDRDASQLETASVSAPVTYKVTEKLEGEVMELSSEELVPVLSSRPKDKAALDPPRAKPSGKRKKRKEIFSKADAAGTSDLYNAYKHPEEKHEIINTTESVDGPEVVDAEKPVTADTDKNVVASEGDGQSKVEVDDWEDAADISTPKLKISENGQQACRLEKYKVDDGNESMSRKYSRDFLSTFSEQYTDLPVGFEIRSDIADALMSVSVGASLVDREPYPSPGRITNRSPGVSQVDRHMIGIVDDDKWTKISSSFASVRDLRPDMGHAAAIMNFRPGQGVSHGVLRHPRGRSSSQFAGGILSGPVQGLASQGGMPCNGIDAERWQRSPGTQRGLIPSPQTPAQVMHRTEKRYEVGKVTDKEETKQRQLKAILNKLTPQNFEKLFQQVKEVDIDNAVTLTGVISQIFDKALMEPTFCEMYADFCYHLAHELPDFIEDSEKITFKRLLLNKCQEEFERGEREEAEANKSEEEGEAKQSEGREEKRIKARRRMLGNIRLIGELYKKRMLTERIMHECIKKLLGQYQNPDEEDIEALCKLMSTIGEMIDHPKAKEHMDAYFDMMAKLSTNLKLSSRVRFMLKDAIDLRNNKWQQRRKVEGPKKIEEVHRDAAQERQAQASRSARGSGISAASRRGPPVDYGLRGSTMLPPPSSHVGNIHNLSSQVRGYGSQGVRLGGRHPLGSKTFSVPLPQRPNNDDSITLGPQGGLARGMSARGQSLISNVLLADVSPSAGDHRRMPSGPNAYSQASDWTPYSSKEEIMPKHMPDGFSEAPHDLVNPQDRNTYFGSGEKILDRSFDRSAATIIPAGHAQASLSGSAGAPSEVKQLSEDVLREKSILAIREFYSARDEEEVSLCIKELNFPNFYPAMISLWVIDSFERKDMERDILATLLVDLCKSRDSLLNQVQLIQGFESVLASLEDAVNDAPRAAEFLGRMFAKVILENVVPLREIGKLLRQGGEEPGRLLELGLASEVLGSTLEVIKMEKGESVLNEIRAISSLRLEDFRPPHPIKAKKLDAFL